MHRGLSLALVACALCALTAAADELTIVSKVTKNDGAPGTATSYIGTSHVRMAQPDGREMMIDLQSGDTTVLDGHRREYFVVTAEDLKAASALMQEKMKAMQPQLQQAQEKMKDMPPQARAAMEKMMGSMSTAVTVQKGATRTIAGYSCDVWTMAIGSISKTEQCLSSALPFPAQAWDRYRELAESMKATMASLGPMGKGISDIQEKTKDMKGVPLWSSTTTSVMGKTDTSVSEVTEVRKGAIPDSAWQIPADFKKVESPMAKMLK
jgi:hypothetical protein